MIKEANGNTEPQITNAKVVSVSKEKERKSFKCKYKKCDYVSSESTNANEKNNKTKIITGQQERNTIQNIIGLRGLKCNKMCKNIEATIPQHPRVANTKTRSAQGRHCDTHFDYVSLCSFPYATRHSPKILQEK